MYINYIQPVSLGDSSEFLYGNKKVSSGIFMEQVSW